MKLLSLCVLLGWLHAGRAVVIRDRCHEGEGVSSCQQCIQKAPECAWCSDPDRSLTARCLSMQEMQTVGCAEAHIHHPQGSVMVVRNHDR